MRRPRRALALLVVGATLALGACSDGDGTSPEAGPADASSTTTTTTGPAGEPADLPSASALDLVPIYGSELEALGVRLTDRGGLIDRSGGGYTQSSQGRHLALYVEPIGAYETLQYIEGIRSITAVFADVFERWPGLESFDVCQEPVEGSEPGFGAGEEDREPLPVTQIELSRAQNEAIAWDQATVVDLVRAAKADPPGLSLRVRNQVSRDPAYEAIEQEAAGPS